MAVTIVIVGGGVIGLATAHELALRGAAVTVLERGEAGGESSWAGGGILFPLLPWHYGEAVTRLTELSRALYPDWIGRLRDAAGEDPEYWTSGLMLLPPFDAGLAADWCARHHLRMEQHGDRLFLPEVAQVRNPRLIKALKRALATAGVRVLEHVENLRLREKSGEIACVETRDGNYVADRYGVAAGAWSGSLLGELAPDMPVYPVRGQMLLFEAEPGLLPHILLQQGIYLIPRRDGHVLVGSTLEQVGFDKSLTDSAKALLWEQAGSMFPPLRQATPVRHWSGLRPGSPGNIPTIGQHPRIKNLFANTGHFRYGVTMAPASAMLMANQILGGVQPIDPAPYVWR